MTELERHKVLAERQMRIIDRLDRQTRDWVNEHGCAFMLPLLAFGISDREIAQATTLLARRNPLASQPHGQV